MIEALMIFALVAGGLVLLAVFAAIGLLLKLTLKIVLFPLWILWALVKVTLLVALVICAAIFAPLLLAFCLLVALPLLLLAGVCSVGWALVT